MRKKKYSLLDEIMSLELLKLDEVLENTKSMKVVRREMVTA
jgi:hypothetical protein